VVAVGGDGTIHEVANGLIQEGATDGAPSLGIVPLGSGSDYAKTFQVPVDPAEAVARLDGPERAVDVGEVVFAAGRRYFVNIAEVGIGAETVRRAARLPRRLGGATYGLAFLATLPLFRRPQAVLELDEERFTGKVTNLVVAVAQYFGGGMHIAPQADPTDGLFDAQVQRGTKLSYVRSLPKVYKGAHLPHPDVNEYRTRALEVRCDPPAAIEADGEVLGTTPAAFRCLPGALRLRA
jgi:diacylglycerol kinase (ATP)